MGAHGATREATVRTAHLAVWTAAWAATLATARFGPERIWDADMWSWVAVGLNVAVGVGWIIAHARYLRGIDELQRKIAQDALAITLGVGCVVAFAYVAADKAELIDRDATIGTFAILLGVVYMLAVAVGHIRYR